MEQEAMGGVSTEWSYWLTSKGMDVLGTVWETGGESKRSRRLTVQQGSESHRIQSAW